MLESFRLDASPQKRPSVQTESPQALKAHLGVSAKGSFDDARSRPNPADGEVPAARYVTVSAILSRSEVYFPAGSRHADILRDTLGEGQRAIPPTSRGPSDGLVQPDAASFGVRRRGSRKAPSNGSALEALGALLLHRDSSGRVSGLSLTKEGETQAGSGLPAPQRSVVQSWTQALNEISKLRPAFALSAANRDGPDQIAGRGTIAERRARKWGSMLLRQGGAAVSESDSPQAGYRTVRSGRSGLSFEVGMPAGSSPEQAASDDGYRDRSGPRGPAQRMSGSLPGTILLKAGKRPDFGRRNFSEYGPGSSFNAESLPEAPPSPVDMPGAWHGGSSWRAKPGEGFEEGALLLPPPLLDDQGSDPHTFEGLLGVRRMREQAKARKQMERLKARNRPTHKVGPLVALLNFVRAAHAAEKQSQAGKTRPERLTRSMSEPDTIRQVGGLNAINGEIEPVAGLPSEVAHAAEQGPRESVKSVPTALGVGPEANAGSDRLAMGAMSMSDIGDGHLAEPNASRPQAALTASPGLQAARRRQASLSRRGSLTNPVDTTGRQLNTVFESGVFDPVIAHESRSMSPRLAYAASPSMGPSSQASSVSGHDLPSAPRLLPIQLSLPPSPFTPLGVDHRSQSRDWRSSSSSSLASDYWSARPIPHAHAPQTPRLGPTILSVPPSPWTPHQGSCAEVMYQLHFNTSSSSLRAPGTPRLIPTHLEVLPSPFPTPAASRRGSVGGERRTSTWVSAPDVTPDAALVMPAMSPSKASADATKETAPRSMDASEQGPPEVAGLKTANGQALRLRRAKGVREALETDTSRLTPSALLRDYPESGSSTPTVADRADASQAAGFPPPALEPLSASPPAPSGDQEASVPRQRSFLLWFLVGDLGLKDTRSAGSRQQEEVGGVAGLLVHIFGFTVFCLAHLVDLIWQMAEHVALAFWFARWLLMNLTGQTVLSRCVLEAYRLIQAEWATVAEEDHEARGSKKRHRVDAEAKARGLSRWQVARGLFELFCLQSVTRERYLQEGAGLVKLEAWSKHSRLGTPAADGSLGSGRLDIGAQKAAARAAIEQATWAASQVESGDDDDDDRDGDDDDDDDDSSDEEMIVTNRGHDILEFSKTPRLDPVRPSQPRKHSGYFGTSYPATASPALRSSASDVASELKALRESPRELVKTIKWASRLAISAYGLHVHIVDLPPTFTPSGNRFSRQTFAYLSRLDAEDVLHADIQTLDVEANYSPTFYIVRDYVRRVVCVAVRGTQSFSDIIVDLEMRTEEVELPQVQPAPGEEFRCHAGIWRAARALVSPDSKLFEKLRLALEENEDFGVIFCGHSLGGAIASAAALLLGEYRVPDGADRDQGSWFTNMSSGLPAHRPIRAISFANPVTMTADLASRAAMGSIPLVTSVVLGSDVIPRAGHGQVREIRRVLGALSRVRRRLAISSSPDDGDARVHIVRSFWDWRSICQSTNPDDVMLHRKERIEEQLWSLRREVESELYAAVKSRLDEAGESASVGATGSDGGGGGGGGGGGAVLGRSSVSALAQREAAPPHQLAARRQALDSATLRSEAAQGGPLIPPGRCFWIEGRDIHLVTSPLSFFSLPEFRLDMFAMHFPAAYEEAILNLRR
ncbi:uncharacterized protein PFL1_00544 [Pseudozyma flocculosa PF-1]|uniref:uncharacterized protein n=1 Tax=Pseudozyma flocculosa PF-1 TaxID=1277687 RepID=UPI0004560723|nr:uncharacterized protein PFL1_00544 [Pseudozyma flocculosa PF-1]EPQ32348.1 hypothetical protein PFL1_00544 [Pseudozyma flocculosa PF-1]